MANYNRPSISSFFIVIVVSIPLLIRCENKIIRPYSLPELSQASLIIEGTIIETNEGFLRVNTSKIYKGNYEIGEIKVGIPFYDSRFFRFQESLVGKNYVFFINKRSKFDQYLIDNRCYALAHDQYDSMKEIINSSEGEVGIYLSPYVWSDDFFVNKYKFLCDQNCVTKKQMLFYRKELLLESIIWASKSMSKILRRVRKTLKNEADNEGDWNGRLTDFYLDRHYRINKEYERVIDEFFENEYLI